MRKIYSVLAAFLLAACGNASPSRRHLSRIGVTNNRFYLYLEIIVVNPKNITIFRRKSDTVPGSFIN
ncbi:hypothetical protein [Rikenella microfusus]|uniref:hypothetical protein n=1 Tax=Rikenella microfusus TaxID=28139 RepID=UPI00248EF218|nr:hypothetical protein [Rikenella microfusus]